MIRPQTCPICDAELPPESASQSDYFPFCSLRCKQVDLFRWASGRYAIVEPLDPDELALEREPDPERDGDVHR